MFLSHSCSPTPSTVLGIWPLHEIFAKWMTNADWNKGRTKDDSIVSYFTAKGMNFCALNLKYFIL